MLKTKTNIENGMKEIGLPILTNTVWDILYMSHDARLGDVFIQQQHREEHILKARE